MAIFDAKATSVTSAFGGFTSPQTNANLTIGANGTAVIAVIITISAAGFTLPTISGAPTWNGVAMTLIASKNNSTNLANVSVYGLASPATGNHTLSVSFSGATAQANTTIDCFSVSGSALATADCFPSANVLTDASTPAGTSYPATAFAVTTNSGDMAAAAMSAAGATNFPTTTGTLIRNDTTAANISEAYALAVGASTSLQFTGGASGGADCGVAFRIAQGPPKGPYDWSAKPGFTPRATVDATKPTNLELYKNPIPFGPYDWSAKPSMTPRAPLDRNQPTNLNLFKNPIPFLNNDYSDGPALVKSAPPMFVAPTSIALLTAPVTAPFYQSQWPKPLQPLPTPADPYPQVFNQALFAQANINLRAAYLSKPFWPLPAAPDVTHASLALLGTVASTPFFPVDWGKSSFPSIRIDNNQPANPNLFTNPVPFNQYDWPQVKKPPAAKEQPSWALNLQLFANPIPFALYDWSKPSGFGPSAPQAPLGSPLVLSANLGPWTQTDFSKPSGYAPSQAAPLPINIALLSPVGVPFVAVDWSRPYFPRPQIDASRATNPNLFINPIPFAQLDWSKGMMLASVPVHPLPYPQVLMPAAITVTPRAPYLSPVFQLRSARSDVQGVNLALTTTVAVAPPFIPLDWGCSSFPPYVAHEHTLLLFFPSAPFVPLDTSSSAFPRATAPWLPVTSLALTSGAVVTAPFYQTSWQAAQAVRGSAPDQQAFNINLYPPLQLVVRSAYLTPQFMRRNSAIDPSQGSNLSLLTAPVLAPFLPIDWSKPFFPRSQIDATAPANPSLFSNPIPFGPFDWSKPFGVARAKEPPHAAGINLNLFGNPIPFFNTMDLRSPARPQWRLVDQGPPNMMLLTAVVVIPPTPDNRYFFNISFGRGMG